MEFEETVNFDENDQEMLNFLTDQEIYMDFNFINELASINTESSQMEEVDSIETRQEWGNFTVKPSSQIEWDKRVQEIAAAIVKNEAKWEMYSL